MKVTHPRPGTLQVKRSRTAAALLLAFEAVFFTGWYAFLLAFDGSSGDDPVEGGPDLFRLMFWVVPLFSLPVIIRQARILTAGSTFTFVSHLGVIERNGKEVARFRDVARVQIRTIRGEGSHEDRLSLVLKNDEKLRIHESSDTKNVADVAEDLADALGVEITRNS